ncbi:DNA polymerase III PolC-type [Anoxybacillus sp. BCO1]|nr:DNA polymerase III PolC-type [Anoxybacillus sp. BCO1]
MRRLTSVFLNAGFKKINRGKVTNPVIDTLELARYLYPELKNHRLNTLCKKFNIELTQHHRAIMTPRRQDIYLFIW